MSYILGLYSNTHLGLLHHSTSKDTHRIKRIQCYLDVQKKLNVNHNMGSIEMESYATYDDEYATHTNTFIHITTFLFFWFFFDDKKITMVI